MSTLDHKTSQSMHSINALVNNNELLKHRLYLGLSEFSKWPEITKVFWLDSAMTHYLVECSSKTITSTGSWYNDEIYVHLNSDDELVLSHRMLQLVIPNNAGIAIYTVLGEHPITNIVNAALIPMLKTILDILDIELPDYTPPYLPKDERGFGTGSSESITEPKVSKKIQGDLEILNAFPPSVLAAKYGNEQRVGRGKRYSKFDMKQLLSRYVNSEYDLMAIYQPNNVIWSRLNTLDLQKQNISGACIVDGGLDENDQQTYKIFTSKWHIVISPTKSNVNMLYNKLCIMCDTDVDDMRAVAAVIKTISDLISK